MIWVSEPLISLIVPIYNVEKYLDRCVKSLVSQTYENIEIILVEDGSPDKCSQICDLWKEKDRRIKVIHKENGGLSDARNTGIKVAKGEYMLFVDSDDWVSPDYVLVLYQAMLSTNADICECEVLKTNGENLGRILEKKWQPVCYGTELALKLLIKDSVFHQYVWNKIYRVACVKDIFFIQGKINEDEFWTYRVFGNANRIAKIDKKMYYYFQRNDSIMGENYNFKHLDALEAKIERQQYIERNFPALSLEARIDLIQSCIYSGQMILAYMIGEERNMAMKRAYNYLKKATKNVDYLFERISFKQNVWLILARTNFMLTCKVRNILKIGF